MSDADREQIREVAREVAREIARELDSRPPPCGFDPETMTNLHRLGQHRIVRALEEISDAWIAGKGGVLRWTFRGVGFVVLAGMIMLIMTDQFRRSILKVLDLLTR